MRSLAKVALLGVWAAVAAGSGMSQVEAKHAAFEVASVRESKSEEKPYSNFPLNPGPQYGDTGGVLVGRNMLLLQ